MQDLNPYIRQIMLKQFGVDKQLKLSQARILVIGAGGLSSPALLYLNAMGIGHIGIIDDDMVEMHNLHRQVLYRYQDIGRLKVEVAREILLERNPQTQIEIYKERIQPSNVDRLCNAYDIMLDGSDNIETRYVLNDACARLKKPWIYGAIYAMEAQLAVFEYPYQGFTTSYSDAFPDPPATGEIQACHEAGVLGLLPGIVGQLQAWEVVKLVTGIAEPTVHQILHIQLNTLATYSVHIKPIKRSTHGS